MKRKEYIEISSVNESLDLSSQKVLITVRAVDSLPGGGESMCYPSGELFGDISAGKFTLVEEWERDYATQCKRGTKYYAGTARTRRGRDRKQHSVVGYSFMWKPRKHEFTVWAVDNPTSPFKTTLEAATARALTKLIGDNLTGAQG